MQEDEFICLAIQFHDYKFIGTGRKFYMFDRSKLYDVAKPNGLSCTYCGSFFHSECSSMFSEVSPDVLSVVKKVTPCPNCETSLKHLPLKVSKLEQRFVEFVAKTEASFSNLSHVPIAMKLETCLPKSR